MALSHTSFLRASTPAKIERILDAPRLPVKRNCVSACKFRPAMFHLTGRGLYKLTLPPSDSRISKVAWSIIQGTSARYDKNLFKNF